MTATSIPDYDFPNPEEATLGTPLVLEGKAYSVESAELSLRMITEVWDGESSVYLKDPSLLMVLDVFVDDSSGEDGAPAPLINVKLVSPIADPKEFFRSEWTDAEVSCDATYGNEAPVLENNRLTLSGIEDGQIGVRWTARYEQDGRRLPFLFDGRATFKGLMGSVKKPADFHATLAKLAPGWSGLRCKVEEKVAFDEPAEGGRPWVDCTITV
jgi:hypothetical protein